MNLNELAKRIHETSRAHGFWPKEGRNFGEMIALAHSELSEALEAHRSNEPSVWYKHSEPCEYVALDPLRDLLYKREGCTCMPKPEGTATELIDCIIRCLDTLYSQDVDIDALIENKMAYNESRPYKHGRNY